LAHHLNSLYVDAITPIKLNALYRLHFCVTHDMGYLILLYVTALETEKIYRICYILSFISDLMQITVLKFHPHMNSIQSKYYLSKLPDGHITHLNSKGRVVPVLNKVL